jgi:apolipoprotein N-acyltransferase
MRINIKRYCLALLAGLTLGASFPKVGFALGAWLAPALMLFAARRTKGALTFRIGYTAGLSHYLLSLHWLLNNPFLAGAVLGWLALCAYLAVFPATWVWACMTLAPRGDQDGRASDTGSPANTLLVPRAGSLARIWWALQCAVLWCAMEMVVGRLLSGFPWNFLGVSQYQNIPLIQIASITGVYGLSFLIIWCSVALYCAIHQIIIRPWKYWAWCTDMVLPLLAIISVTIWGYRQIFQNQPSTSEIKVALVQPSIPQELIWDPTQNESRFGKLIELSKEALESKPDILIWPEAAVPSFPRYNQTHYSAITNLLNLHPAWVIMGADDMEPQNESANFTDWNPADWNFYNGALLIDPEGVIVASYHKRQLVMFGEYVPFSSWLPFLRHLTPIDGSFTPGVKSPNFELNELGIAVSILICFEDVFPQLVRKSINDSTDFLVNLTNDAWFKQSAAQWQHACNAAFRTVETRLPLIRCTNNGISCYIDPYGRMHEMYNGDSQDVYGEYVKVFNMPLFRHQDRAATVYARWGDCFGWACVALALLLLAPASYTFFKMRFKN